MKLALFVLACAGALSSVSASAQSYSAPGNDYVRQHPHADEALWRYCQTHRETDERCYAVTRPWPVPSAPAPAPVRRGHRR